MDRSEMRLTDPKTGGKKARKLSRFDLLPPDALIALAEHYGRNCEKYEDRNWEKGYAWGLSFRALMTHACQWWAGEDMDPDSQGRTNHMVAVAWHALTLLAFQMRGLGTDDRSKVGL